LDKDLLRRLRENFPTARKKEEAPLPFYLSCEIAPKLHGAASFSALRYVLHCGGVKDALGVRAGFKG